MTGNEYVEIKHKALLFTATVALKCFLIAIVSSAVFLTRKLANSLSLVNRKQEVVIEHLRHNITRFRNATISSNALIAAALQRFHFKISIDPHLH